MNVSQASKIWLEYHRAHLKHNTVRAYLSKADSSGVESLLFIPSGG